MPNKKTSGWTIFCDKCDKLGPKYGKYSKMCCACADKGLPEHYEQLREKKNDNKNR